MTEDRDQREPFKKLKDTKGRIYTALTQNPLGKGGQGEVLRVADDNYLAIKLAFIDDPNKIKEYQTHVQNIRFLPLDVDDKISLPIAILQDEAGYVMQLLGDMKPLKKFLFSEVKNLNNIKIPKWLGANPNDNNVVLKSFAFYAQSGGLRQRLKLLLQVCDLLGKLHQQGLIFADLSPNNVYVTEGQQKEVYLIDVDNISFEGSAFLHVFTSNFGAPEIVKGEACNSQESDIFSFALIAFELLTMQKPFEGCVTNKADFDESDDLYVNFPWILDRHDRSNVLNGDVEGFKYFLSLPLFNLFTLTFEQGKELPKKRPPLWLWKEALQQALDLNVYCPHCGMSFILSELIEETCCPFCQSALSILIATFEDRLIFAHECNEEEITIPAHLFAPCKAEQDATPLKIRREDDDIIFCLTDLNLEFFYSLDKKTEQVLNRDNPQIKLKLSFFAQQDVIFTHGSSQLWPISFSLSKGN